VFLSVLMLCSITASAQVYFEKTYKPSNDFNAEGFWTPSFEMANQNEYISIGLTTNLSQGQGWLVKTNANGDTLQTKLFGNLNRNYKPFSALYTDDNKIMILCNAVGDSTLEMDLIITDSDFNIESIYNYRNDTFSHYASHLVETENGYLIVTGVDYKNSTVLPDACLLFIDRNGNRVWEKIYGGDAYDAFVSAIYTADKGFLALGTTRSFGAKKWYLVKTDSLGNQQWEKTYESSNDVLGWGITQKSDGNFILTGIGGNTSYSRGIIRVVDPDGITLWTRQYTYENEDQNLYWTYELADGSLISVGLTNSDNAGYLQKTDSEGNLLWQHKYNYNDNTDLFYNVLPTADGGFLLSGQCANDTIGQDAWLLKVDSFGCPYPNCTVAIAEENKTVAFNMWPSPATETLNIDIESFALNNTTLYITDLSGRKVLEYCPTQKLAQLDISKFASGVYFLHLQTATQNTRVKFVKE